MTFFEILLFLGNTPGANLLTTIFGSTTNRYYESTGEYLYIRFTSDNAVEKSGFSLQYFSLFSTGKITFSIINLRNLTNKACHSTDLYMYSQQPLNIQLAVRRMFPVSLKKNHLQKHI